MTAQNSLEDICFWHKIAEEEKELNDMPRVVKAYEKMGCYECDGFNFDCERYISLKKLMDF